MRNRFFTEVTWQGPPLEGRARYEHRMISLGSCFSDNIGRWLSDLGFQISVNPFGTLYNPLSLTKALFLLSNSSFKFSEEDLFYDGSHYRSFMHHSRYAHQDSREALEQMNRDLQKGREHLLHGEWLFLTLGTSYYYRLLETGAVVANCHKLPAQKFQKECLKSTESTQALSDILASLLLQNPRLRIIITVSPIRYLSYGATDNMRSKAILLQTAGYLEQTFPEHIYYFPAFEMMMDELRDYRFYAQDLIHPSDLAIELIREKLLQGWLHPDEEKELLERSNALRKKRHRILLS